MKMYRIYLREGPNDAGIFWGREFGIDFETLAKAREVKTQYVADFPTARYFIRAAQPRYQQDGVETGRLAGVTN